MLGAFLGFLVCLAAGGPHAAGLGDGVRADRGQRRARRTQEPEARGDCFLSVVLVQFWIQVVVVVAVLLLPLVMLAVVVVDVDMLRRIVIISGWGFSRLAV